MGKPGGRRLGREAAQRRHAVKLTREIEQALRQITATLPQGITADQILFRQANFIETSIRNVQRVLLEAAVVVAVVLFAFLLNWRTTAISLTAIPVSILTTAVIFYFAGLSINTMTLGGLAIAIGELVDDAVVDVENIFRRLRENRALDNPRAGLRRGGIGLAGGALRHRLCDRRSSSWCSCRCSRSPASRAACSRRSGIAYIISILASLVVSITLTPVMAYYMLPRLKRLGEHESPLVRRAQARQPRRCSSAAFRHARAAA